MLGETGSLKLCVSTGHGIAYAWHDGQGAISATPLHPSPVHARDLNPHQQPHTHSIHSPRPSSILTEVSGSGGAGEQEREEGERDSKGGTARRDSKEGQQGGTAEQGGEQSTLGERETRRERESGNNSKGKEEGGVRRGRPVCHIGRSHRERR
eukprot:696025-Rhodomonas_salina.2